jgi:hypothetical protein
LDKTALTVAQLALAVVALLTLESATRGVYLAVAALAAFVGREAVRSRAKSKGARLDKLADQIEKLDKLYRDAGAATVKLEARVAGLPCNGGAARLIAS